MRKSCLKPFPVLTLSKGLAVLALLFVLACGTEATTLPTDTEAPPATPLPTDTQAPPPTATQSATRADVLEGLTAGVILPGYTAAAESMAEFSQSVDAMCSGPSEDALGAARDAWREARGAWLRTESYRFGPAMDRRSISLVDWWPIDVEKIERNLADEEAVTPERVKEFLPSTQRGISVAEYLLFSPNSAGLADGSAPARCAYLQSVASVNSEEVAGILADWQGSGGSGGYAGYFDGTGSLALFDSDAEAEVVRSLVFQVRAIANMRLGAALGVDVTADASAIPSGPSNNGEGNSREDLLSQLDGIASVYRGVEGGMGLSARVASISADTDARMLAAIEATIAATRRLEGSIIAQVEANPAQVRAVYDNLKELQRVLNTEIVSLLGVSVGFSDTDGDS